MNKLGIFVMCSMLIIIFVGGVYLAWLAEVPVQKRMERQEKRIDKVELLWEGQVVTNGVLRRFRKRIIKLENRRCR